MDVPRETSKVFENSPLSKSRKGKSPSRYRDIGNLKDLGDQYRDLVEKELTRKYKSYSLEPNVNRGSRNRSIGAVGAS